MSRRLSSYVVKKLSVDNGENTKIKKCISVKKFIIIKYSTVVINGL